MVPVQSLITSWRTPRLRNEVVPHPCSAWSVFGVVDLGTDVDTATESSHVGQGLSSAILLKMPFDLHLNGFIDPCSASLLCVMRSPQSIVWSVHPAG
jgi:hypothetical protein